MDTANLIDDVVSRLEREQGVLGGRVIHLQDRFFSRIYEVAGSEGGVARSYILKVGTTERSCREEYEAYAALKSLGLRTLTPVLHSQQYNYLLTVKEEVTTLPEVVKSCGNGADAEMFFRFGQFLKELESKTSQGATFSSDHYLEYLSPRFQRIRCIGGKRKGDLWRGIAALSSREDNAPSVKSMVSDFNLGNVHLTSEGEFILIDLGDAHVDDRHSNLAVIYLSLKFGPLQQYFENRKRTGRYFDSFLKGYGLRDVDRVRFALFQIRTLVCMILFIESFSGRSGSRLRRFLSACSDRYLLARYVSYLGTVLEGVA